MSSTALTTTLTLLAREHALLTVSDAAAAMGVTPWWVRQLIKSGGLRAINIGGHDKATRWRVDPEDLRAWLASRENRSRDLIA